MIMSLFYLRVCFLKDVTPVSFDQHYWHLTFKPYLSSESYSRKKLHVKILQKNDFVESVARKLGFVCLCFYLLRCNSKIASIKTLSCLHGFVVVFYFLGLKTLFAMIVYISFYNVNSRNILKMLGLYLYTLIIGHKSCNMLSILNKLPLQKELQILWQITCFFGQNVKTLHQKKTHKNPCPSREMNPGQLAPKADALPLHHRVNWKYRL